MSKTDTTWMARALALAQQGKGLTAPNPVVGAVLIRGGRLLGEGWHRKAGGPHAEVAAVRDAKRKGHAARLPGATLYVTLEPCSTSGRTPPCTELIKREGFSRVVVGATDPNPKHAGRGLRLLRRAGITVKRGVMAKECDDLNRDWNHFITTGRPWVVAKIAMSLDGRIAAPEPGHQWITGVEARTVGHVLRLEADAIVIGAATARADNPRLTIRLPRGHEGAAAARAKTQPQRLILTRRGRLPRTLHLFKDEHRDRTRVERNITWPDLLCRLGAEGCVNILLEGGGGLLGDAFAAGIVNEVAFFIAPSIIGTGPMAVQAKGLAQRLRLSPLKITPIGDDFFVRALVQKRPR